MKSMKLSDFIDENRYELNECINRVLDRELVNDDDETELWILNDEGLYNWAENCGVNFDDPECKSDDSSDDDLDD